jgi:hypothetical protein
MARPAKICEEAVNLAELALSRRLHKCDIKALLKKQYGLEPRSVERVLARARERLIERSNKTVDHHRDDAYAFYDAIIRDSAAPIRFKILAQERIDRLLGLQRPERLELTGQGGGPVEVTAPDYSKLSLDELKMLKTIVSKAKRPTDQPKDANSGPVDVQKP